MVHPMTILTDNESTISRPSSPSPSDTLSVSTEITCDLSISSDCEAGIAQLLAQLAAKDKRIEELEAELQRIKLSVPAPESDTAVSTESEETTQFRRQMKQLEDKLDAHINRKPDPSPDAFPILMKHGSQTFSTGRWDCDITPRTTVQQLKVRPRTRTADTCQSYWIRNVPGMTEVDIRRMRYVLYALVKLTPSASVVLASTRCRDMSHWVARALRTAARSLSIFTKLLAESCL